MKNLLTIQDTADLLGLHYLTVRKYVNNGVIKSMNLNKGGKNKTIRVYRSDLTKFFPVYEAKV